MATAPLREVKKEEDAGDDITSTTTTTTGTTTQSLPIVKPEERHYPCEDESDSPLSSLDSEFEDPTKRPSKMRTTTTTTTTTRKRKLSDDDDDGVISPASKTAPRSKKAPRGKREAATTTTTTTTTTLHSTPATPSTRPKRPRAPAKRTVDPDTGDVRVTPPANWEEVYALTTAMRAQVLAPVDTMGCEALADGGASAVDQRFQTLVSLMLSSQTKDTVTAAAVRTLQAELEGGLSVASILKVEPEVLNRLIGKVGFHNNKTKYLKATAQVLLDKFEGDIPDTITGMTALPGVGPKMAYLCMSAAWGRDEGIGVDVHVHRITNLWRWHKTKTPEETRAALEAWLPKEKWHDINHLLVGFGQTWCPPVGRKCDACMLAEKGLCPSAVVSKTTKSTKVKEEAKITVEYSS